VLKPRFKSQSRLGFAAIGICPSLVFTDEKVTSNAAQRHKVILLQRISWECWLLTVVNRSSSCVCMRQNSTAAAHKYWTTAIHYHASHQLIKTACQHLCSQNPHSLRLHVPSFLQVFFSLGHTHAFNCHSLSLALEKSGLVFTFLVLAHPGSPGHGQVCVCVCQGAVMPCSWEGNRRSGIALAMCQRLQWFIHLRAHGPWIWICS